MVQIHAFLILKSFPGKPHPIIMAGHIQTDAWLAWLYKDSLTEFAQFFSKLLAEKIKPGTKTRVEKDKFIGYVDARPNVTGVLLTDDTYPLRVAFDLVRKGLDQFAEQTKDLKLSEDKLKDFCITPQNEVIKGLVQKYQDPTEADKMLKIKKDLDDTKEVLHQALDKLLDRGQNIEKLIEQSDQLSNESKLFYRKARQTNCCNLW
jgi:synaptobrevin family protein YKT6